MENTVYKALWEAGEILMNHFGKISDYEVKESQSSIVTKADFEAERKIIEIITKNFAAHNTLGEETGFQNRNSEYTWVIDPLDGTSNFAAGIPWFGVIICVLKNSAPIMGGCYLPHQRKIYFAEKGKGALINNKHITVTSETELKNILVSYSLDFSSEPGKTEEESQMMGRLVQHIRNLRSTNCLIDFCYTADGRLGASINQTTKIWDIAGPGLIIEEAGGKISDIQGNSLDYNIDENNCTRNFTIVASNQKLHPRIIELINQ